MKSQNLKYYDLFRMYDLSYLRALPLNPIISSLEMRIAYLRDSNSQEISRITI